MAIWDYLNPFAEDNPLNPFGSMMGGGGGPMGGGGGMGGMMGGMNPFGGGGSGMFAGMEGGGILGALTGAEAVYGRKPRPVVAPTPTDIVNAALSANIAGLPAMQQVAGQTNTFNQAQLLDLFSKSLPGAAGEIQDKRLRNISSQLDFDLPDPLKEEIWREGAAHGITSGTLGSDFNRFRGLRNLGVNALQYGLAGERAARDVAEETRRYTMPEAVNPLAFALRPDYDPYAEFQNALFNEKVAAAPVPAAAGAAAAQQALLESILAIYSGSPKSAATDPRAYGTDWGTVPTEAGRRPSSRDRYYEDDGWV